VAAENLEKEKFLINDHAERERRSFEEKKLLVQQNERAAAEALERERIMVTQATEREKVMAAEALEEKKLLMQQQEKAAALALGEKRPWRPRLWRKRNC